MTIKKKCERQKNIRHMRGTNYAEILHTNETKPICDNLEKYIHTYTVGEFCHDQNKTND
jgi:hypothetical protein